MSPFPSMIAAVRTILAALLLCPLLPLPALGQCAPAPDSAYFFRNLSEQRAEARIAGTRETYEKLLGMGFFAKRLSGEIQDKRAFIDTELADGSASNRRPFYSIREYTLVEHRKGFTVASYLLIEGTTGGGETRAVESWQRETYEVQDGQWRLTGIEIVPEPRRL